jgi:hypothetical protein
MSHCTNGWRGQKLKRPLHLQDKLFMPDKDGYARCHPSLVFLFLLFLFLLTTNVTRALPLGTIKGEAETTSRGFPIRSGNNNMQSNGLISHTTTKTWDSFPLSNACNPYHMHFGARLPEQQQHTLDVGIFCPKQYKSLCPFCTSSEPKTRRYKFTRRSV